MATGFQGAFGREEGDPSGGVEGRRWLPSHPPSDDGTCRPSVLFWMVQTPLDSFYYIWRIKRTISIVYVLTVVVAAKDPETDDARSHGIENV
jgi:hypothetical protein